MTIDKRGDLLLDVWIEVVLTNAGASYYPAEALLGQVDLFIGDRLVDSHPADWFRVYDSLFRTGDAAAAYRRMTGFDSQTPGQTRRMYVPLLFFFCGQAGAAVPLVALQDDDVKVSIRLAPSVAGLAVVPGAAVDMTVWADYAFLDVDERRGVARADHEFLVERCRSTSPRRRRRRRRPSRRSTSISSGRSSTWPGPSGATRTARTRARRRTPTPTSRT